MASQLNSLILGAIDTDSSFASGFAPISETASASVRGNPAHAVVEPLMNLGSISTDAFDSKSDLEE